MEALDFFRAIFGSGVGYAVLVLPNRSGKPTSDFWFEYPAQLDEMADFVWSNEHTDVWFSPSLFSEKDRHKESASYLGHLCGVLKLRLSRILAVGSSDTFLDFEDAHLELCALRDRLEIAGSLKSFVVYTN